MTKPLNILFAGTPEFAEIHLNAIINSGHSVVGVYTQPDRPSGRGKRLTASPVKRLATQHDISVYQPSSLKNEDAQKELASLNADVMVVVAYGLLLPKPVLDTPKYGCINVHGSILPRWRGAAPIQRAIEAGDITTGVTIMQMDIGLDTGDMLLKTECNIESEDTSARLHDKLCKIGPPALLEVLTQIANDHLVPEKQNDAESNYAKKIEKEEAKIDWQEDAYVIERKIRAFNPFPICYTTLNNERIKIHNARVFVSHSQNVPGDIINVDRDAIRVQCGENQLDILALQLPGKKPMEVSTFLNGYENLLHADKKSPRRFI